MLPIYHAVGWEALIGTFLYHWKYLGITISMLCKRIDLSSRLWYCHMSRNLIFDTTILARADSTQLWESFRTQRWNWEDSSHFTTSKGIRITELLKSVCEMTVKAPKSHYLACDEAFELRRCTNEQFTYFNFWMWAGSTGLILCAYMFGLCTIRIRQENMFFACKTYTWLFLRWQ
jgi:hypothetical protein